jgi:hypothetical protein
MDSITGGIVGAVGSPADSTWVVASGHSIARSHASGSAAGVGAWISTAAPDLLVDFASVLRSRARSFLSRFDASVDDGVFSLVY